MPAALSMIKTPSIAPDSFAPVEHRRNLFPSFFSLHSCMHNNSAYNDRAADQGPPGRSLADNQKNPDRIQYRLDITDDARIERANAARHSEREEGIGNSDLHHPEVDDAERVVERDARERLQTCRRRDENYQQVAIDNRRRAIYRARAGMPQQEKVRRKTNS